MLPLFVRRDIKVRKLIVFSVIIHILLFLGVKDIYFTSPVERGMPPHKSEARPLAKRIVIFLSDGLRAEGIFHSSHKNRAPYLTNVCLQRGSWGVSHTRVPTESRPGHVAVLAGMYEDPSAVMEGWRNNPIDFDHVFNQSRNSWLWGSPDIVPMFNREKNERIHIYHYSPNFEDFSGKQRTTELDRWVFNSVKAFVSDLKTGNCTDVCEDRSIFFLHLLGLDTVGHVHKPNSRQYVENIRFVDAGVQEMEAIFEDFFGDTSTAYIFTSDHGMTDWGSHGSGTLFETEAPFIAWGAGVRKDARRNDLPQADIAPLISTLIGINIPINSVGVLPDSYLNFTEEQHAHALFANALQLGEQYNAKRLKMERNTLPILFTPFVKLNGEHFDRLVEVITYHLKTSKFDDAIRDSRELLQLIQDGLLYYKHYYKVSLLTCLASGFFLWIVYLGISIVNFYEEDFTARSPQPLVRPDVVRRFVGCVVAAIAVLWLALFCKAQSVEGKYYGYAVFPFAVLIMIALEADQLVYTLMVIRGFGVAKFGILSATYLVGIELFVLTFFNRAFIGVTLAGIVGWMYYHRDLIELYDRVFSAVLCVGVGLFPLLPEVSFKYSYTLSVFTMSAWVYTLMIMLFNYLSSYRTRPEPYRIMYFFGLAVQIVAMSVSALIVVCVAIRFREEQPVPNLVYATSWVILLLSFLTMHMSPRNLLTRTFTITNSLLTVYFLMTFSSEGLFLVMFVLLLNQWCYAEFCTVDAEYVDITYMKFHEEIPVERASNAQDFRRSFFFIIFILTSYFGAGNIANLNSFDPMWTQCFVSVFSPFTMAALIMLKITIPFLLTTVFYRLINKLTCARMANVFCIVLLICDIMILNFVFLVRNEGSWLEIGLSISRFSIAVAMTFVLLLFYVIAYFITCSPFYDLIYNKYVAGRYRRTD